MSVTVWLKPHFKYRIKSHLSTIVTQHLRFVYKKTCFICSIDVDIVLLWKSLVSVSYDHCNLDVLLLDQYLFSLYRCVRSNPEGLTDPLSDTMKWINQLSDRVCVKDNFPFVKSLKLRFGIRVPMFMSCFVSVTGQWSKQECICKDMLFVLLNLIDVVFRAG